MEGAFQLWSLASRHPVEMSLPVAFPCRRSPRFRRAFGCAQSRRCAACGSPSVTWRNGETLRGCRAGPSREVGAGGTGSEDGAWHECGDVSGHGQGVAIGWPGTSDQVRSSRGCQRKFGGLGGGSSRVSCSETLRPGAGLAGSMARPALLRALKRGGSWKLVDPPRRPFRNWRPRVLVGHEARLDASFRRADGPGRTRV